MFERDVHQTLFAVTAGEVKAQMDAVVGRQGDAQPGTIGGHWRVEAVIADGTVLDESGT